LDFIFTDVICGNRATLALINEAPFLLQWGGLAEASHSKQYHEFELDRPVKIDCGGQFALILTEKGVLYRLDTESYKLEEVMHQGNEEHEEAPIVQMACGSDYSLILREDGNVQAQGLNGCGQLGMGDLQSRKEGYTVIEGLLNWNVLQVYAGNQHSVAVLQQTSFQGSLKQEVLDVQQGKLFGPKHAFKTAEGDFKVSKEVFDNFNVFFA